MPDQPESQLAPRGLSVLAPFLERPSQVLLGGILGLLVAMGIGRFAYTLLLPLMQAEYGFGSGTAGWLATANFSGYLAGSFAATAWPASRGVRYPLVIAFAASALTTLAMGLTASVPAWLVLRFLSGTASAWIFVFVTAHVLTVLREAGRGDQAGWMYGGVGIGIALTSIVALALPVRTSGSLWILFGIAGAIIAAASAALLPKHLAVAMPLRNAPVPADGVRHAWRTLVVVAYSLEGIGYIVSATFIVAVVKTAQGQFESGAWAWMIVGLAGIPACVMWTRRTNDRGVISRLETAYWIQAAGIVLVALAPGSRAAALLSAATLGATLTGIVMLTMALAPRIDPENPRRTIGQLTIGFSAGQMVGPVIAGYAADYFGSYTVPLLGSAVLLVISALATRKLA